MPASFLNSSKTRRIQSVGCTVAPDGSNTFNVFTPQTCASPVAQVQESPWVLWGRLEEEGATLALLVPSREDTQGSR